MQPRIFLKVPLLRLTVLSFVIEVSPGSLHMNLSIENIVYTEFTIEKFGTTEVICSKPFFLVNFEYTNNVFNA